MIKFILKTIFALVLIYALKQVYFHYTVSEYTDTVDAEFEYYGDEYEDDDDLAYDDYDTESDW